MAKEFVCAGIFENLAPPEQYAVFRSDYLEQGQPSRVRCGAGVAANLVKMGLAEWVGPSTWQCCFTPLGGAVATISADL